MLKEGKVENLDVPIIPTHFSSLTTGTEAGGKRANGFCSG